MPVHSNALVFLIAAAIFLFIYSFTSRAVVQPQEQSHSSRLSPVPSSLINTQSLLDKHVIGFYKAHAPQRKSMFNAALKSLKASVPQVLLPIVEEVFCPSLVRVGSVGDGGKWVCNPWATPRNGVVFSLGSHDDISFETDFQKITNTAASIITVDMNAASKAALEGLSQINAVFVHAMIADKTELAATPPHFTVQDLMKKMKHEHIEILKMDIEGAEFTVLPQFLKSNSVCQIMVEIHTISETPKLLRAIANAGFLLQKYELNAFWTGIGLCEYSFLHESCLEKYGAVLLASYLKE
ncbi:hypothetical protein PFISCL1PPCAC_15828 [Pristionchus fissidentatus]|uniref:Methyltransferase domain-containing protein n=1 Tax=Pristionchus fissidentatus TaxID=1538716 RepID=A0AAV5W198_9BILA|nr:hypothetical protein PFISCL1PPCAC_15828 [Pristionchus fissidentatus]